MHIFSIFLFLDGVLREIPFNTSEMLDAVIMDQKILYVIYACAEFC